MLRLPDPMLAKTGPIPTASGWSFEPKLDGFRCLVCTHGRRFRARSRRGWDMTTLLPDLARIVPEDVQLDGELVAFNAGGQPDFHLLSRRMVHKRPGIPVGLMVFDLLAVEGLSVIQQPYAERRALLDELGLDRPGLQVVGIFEDGQALFDAVCTRGLEGVVAKRLRDPYRPGERLWVKTKNRTTRRFAEERVGATRGVGQRTVSR